MNYALKLDNVCKTYETSDFLLDNVSFEVPMGSVMGFVGENGAGKTTTIGCILNTLFRNSGYSNWSLFLSTLLFMGSRENRSHSDYKCDWFDRHSIRIDYVS